MKFQCIPPDPTEFPRIRLVWPVVAPAFLLLVMWTAELFGHQWNIHGDGILLIGAFALSIVVGIVASLLGLASLIPALHKYPTLRTPFNLACTGVSVAFVAISLIWVIFGVGAAVAS